MMPEDGPQDQYKITLEIDYTHFTTCLGWMNIVQIICGILSMACCAPAPFPTQIYFLVIVVTGFIGSIVLSCLHLRFVTFNKLGKQTEFIYTVSLTFFYMTAFIAQFADLGGFADEEYQHRWAAQIVAGVFAVINDISLVVSLYLMFPDAKMWYEEIKGGTKPQGEQ